jgi:hypothetical protein
LRKEKKLITLFSSWHEIVILSRLRGCYNIDSDSIIDELYSTKHRTSKDVTLIVDLFLLSLQFYVVSNLFFNILNSIFVWIKILLLTFKIHVHELIIDLKKKLYIYLIANNSDSKFWVEDFCHVFFSASYQSFSFSLLHVNFIVHDSRIVVKILIY